MRIVWKWKANLSDYVGLPQVVRVCPTPWKKNDGILTGRDGWVGYLEESPDGK